MTLCRTKGRLLTDLLTNNEKELDGKWILRRQMKILPLPEEENKAA